MGNQAGAAAPTSGISRPGTTQNENTTTAAEPVSIGGGERFASFDDLEAIHDAESASKKAAKRDAKGASAGDKVPGADLGKETEQSDTAPDTKVEAAKLAATKAAEKGKAAADPGKDAPKTLKVMGADGKALELSLDSKVEIPINGKLESVTLADLKAEFSGKTDWTRRYQELDKQTKSFKAIMAEVEGAIEEVGSFAKNGDAQGAMEYLYEILGGDPHQARIDLKKWRGAQEEKYKGLSDEERAAAELKEENEYLKKRVESRAETDKKQKERTAMQTRIDTALEKAGLAPEKYKELYNEIRTSGKVKPEDLTPELVVQYHQAIQREEKVVGVLAEVAPELQNELKVISELRDVWDKNPSFTVDDISDIAKDVYGNKAAKALSRKVKKAEPVKVAPEGTPAKDPRQEAVTFDDLE